MRKVKERGSKERARGNSRAFVRGAGMERRYDEARGRDSRALRGKVVEERKRFKWFEEGYEGRCGNTYGIDGLLDSDL